MWTCYLKYCYFAKFICNFLLFTCKFCWVFHTMSSLFHSLALAFISISFDCYSRLITFSFQTRYFSAPRFPYSFYWMLRSLFTTHWQLMRVMRFVFLDEDCLVLVADFIMSIFLFMLNVICRLFIFGTLMLIVILWAWWFICCLSQQ